MMMENVSLHAAVTASYLNAIKKLINWGLNVNTVDEDGRTPLFYALYKPNSPDVCEIISLLLVEGAEVTIANFEISVMHDFPVDTQENLFLYSWQNNSKLRLDVILELAKKKSPLLDEIIKNPPTDVVITETYEYLQTLCEMDFSFLKIAVENFGTYLAEALRVQFGILTTKPYEFFFEKLNYIVVCLENLGYLLENELIKSELVNFISHLSSENSIFDTFVELYREPHLTHFSSEKQLSEFYLFLLSYGLQLRECDLQLVYYFFGRCDLFQIMLHMEFQDFSWPDDEESNFRLAFPEFLYKPEMVVEKYFDTNLLYRVYLKDELFSFFAHPKLTEIYRKLLTFESGGSKNRDLFPFPSLIELARNSCREFLIKRYNIQNCREFYTILKWLPINNVLKKIISYERKLYNYAR